MIAVLKKKSLKKADLTVLGYDLLIAVLGYDLFIELKSKIHRVKEILIIQRFKITRYS